MKLSRLVAAVGAVCLLGACSPAPTTALVIEGQRYTNADIDSMVDGCNESGLIGPRPISRVAVTNLTIKSEAANKVLVQASDTFADQVKEVRNSISTSPVVAQGSDAMKNCAKLLLIKVPLDIYEQNTQDTSFLVAAAREMKIELNPSYGTFDPNQEVTYKTSGSLSVPVEQ